MWARGRVGVWTGRQFNQVRYLNNVPDLYLGEVKSQPPGGGGVPRRTIEP